MPVELPDCVSVADNYFVREGLYFTGYDAQRLSDIFSQAIAKGQERLLLVMATGTGKTYNSVVYAVAICEEKDVEDVEKEDFETIIKHTQRRYNHEQRYFRNKGRIRKC